MRIAHWIAAALLLSACSDGNDTALLSGAYVDLIEQRLAKHPCIGDLEKWERNYRFAKPTGLSAYTAHADIDIVEFHLRRSGTTTIVPGRNVMRRGESDDWPDGKNIRSIDGRYKIGENRLSLSRCGRLTDSQR